MVSTAPVIVKSVRHLRTNIKCVITFILPLFDRNIFACVASSSFSSVCELHQNGFVHFCCTGIVPACCASSILIGE